MKLLNFAALMKLKKGLVIALAVLFASAGAFAYGQIITQSSSVPLIPDVVVYDHAGLVREINDSLPGVPRVIAISADITGGAIIVTGGRDIILTSSNPANPITYQQTTEWQRHFSVSGANLTIADLILQGPWDGESIPALVQAGGVTICVNGTFTLQDGGVLEYISYNIGGTSRGTAVEVTTATATFRMVGGEVRHNITHGGGYRGIIGFDGTVIIEDGRIHSNLCANGNVHNTGIVQLWAGRLEIHGGAIEYNRALHGQSAGVTVNWSALPAIMTGGAIRHNHSEGTRGGGGVFVSVANFTMTGGEIYGNTAAAHGGGVLITSGTFNLQGGIIRDNVAGTTGGGVHLAGGVFNLQGGAIQDNVADTTGGGIHLQAGTLTIDGTGEVTNNQAQNGGGIQLAGGTQNLVRGRIHGNTATSHGGGLNLLVGIPTLSEGFTISDNQAQFGGGLAIQAGTNVISHSQISDNRAQNGGGVWIGPIWAARFTMDGGVVERNVATQNGGGIWAACDTWPVSGGLAVVANAGAFRYNQSTGNGGAIFTTRFNFGATMPANAFNMLSISENVYFTGNQAASSELSPDITALTRIRSASSSVPGQNILNNFDINFLRDIRVSDHDELHHAITNLIQPGGAATIELLNSFDVTDARVIHVTGNRSITLTSDTRQNNVFTYRQERPGQRHFLVSGATLTIENLILQGPWDGETTPAPISSGGVTINASGQFILQDGGILEYISYDAGSSSRGTAVEVTIATATFRMEGGEVRHNITQSGEFRGIIGFGGTVIIEDGRIHSNLCINENAYNTGTIHLWAGHLEIHGGSIEHNRSLHGRGAGVNISWSAIPVTMTGGTIRYNRSEGPRGGGGVSVAVANFTMSGGEIYNNTAAAHGGGVLLSSGTFNLQGGIIRDNVAGTTGGGVMLHGGTFNLQDGAVRENTAGIHGGGLSLSGGHVRMYGGAVEQNRAIVNGGGFHVGNIANALDIQAGIIGNNTAGSQGGGIFTARFAYEPRIPIGTAFRNIQTSDEVHFTGNRAGGHFHPPFYAYEDLPNIRWYGNTLSAPRNHPLNNYDINFQYPIPTDFPFQFTKTDGGIYRTVPTINPLPGAEFTLYRFDESLLLNPPAAVDPNAIPDGAGSTAIDHTLVSEASIEAGFWTPVDTVTTDATGKVEFPLLIDHSIYQLVENIAPEDFLRPEGQWRILIASPATQTLAITPVGDAPEFQLINDTWHVGNLSAFTLTLHQYPEDQNPTVLHVDLNQSLHADDLPYIGDSGEHGWSLWGWFFSDALYNGRPRPLDEAIPFPLVGTEITRALFPVGESNLDLFAVWHLWGDLNGDGEVNDADLDIMRAYMAKQITHMGPYHQAGDVMRDGQIDILDFGRLQRWLANIPNNDLGKP